MQLSKCHKARIQVLDNTIHPFIHSPIHFLCLVAGNTIGICIGTQYQRYHQRILYYNHSSIYIWTS